MRNHSWKVSDNIPGRWVCRRCGVSGGDTEDRDGYPVRPHAYLSHGADHSFERKRMSDCDYVRGILDILDVMKS